MLPMEKPSLICRVFAIALLSAGRDATRTQLPIGPQQRKPGQHCAVPPHSETELSRHLLQRHAVQREPADHLFADRADAAVEVDPGVDDLDKARVRLALDAVAAR